MSNLCWSGLEKLLGIGKEVWGEPFQGVSWAAQVGGVAWATRLGVGDVHRVSTSDEQSVGRIRLARGLRTKM